MPTPASSNPPAVISEDPTVTNGAKQPHPMFLGVPILSYREIMGATIAPPEWDIEGLVARGQRVMLIGQWGAFKSWLLQHLALHYVAPLMWLETFAIPKQRSVLYLDKEMSWRASVRRLQQLAKGAELPLDEDLPLHLVSHPPITMDADGATTLIQELDKLHGGPDVIMTETFRRVLVGAEKEQEDVSRFWAAVEPIFKAGKTTYFSHHMRKPKKANENSREMASGSTDILAGADGVIAVTRTKLTADFELEHIKNRDGDEYQNGAPLALSIFFPRDEAERYTGPVTIQSPDSLLLPAPSGTQAKVMLAQQTYALTQETVTTARLIEEGKKAGGSLSSCERGVKDLKKLGVLLSEPGMPKGVHRVHQPSPSTGLAK